MLTAFFDRERLAVTKVIQTFLPKAHKAAGDNTPPDIDAILAAIDFGVWDDLVRQISPQLDITGQEAVARVFATLDLSPTSDLFSLSDTQALEYAQTRGAELVGKKWVGGALIVNPNAKWAITEATREELRGLIAEAFAENWTPADLAERIDSAYSFSPGRAEMIARTETAFAQTAASVNAAKNVGAKTKTVQLSSIHDQDDECDEAQAAGEVPIDEAYPDGSLHVPLHPRCCCVELLHIVKDDDDDDD